MINTKFTLFSVLFICLILILSFGNVKANIEKEIVNEMPESWFEAPKTASELGITNFNQSSILKEKVEEGNLPSVKKRLPEDPPSIEPLDRIGEYGGTHRLLQTGLDSISFDGQKMIYPGLFRTTPLGKKMVPSIAKNYEFNEEKTSITIEFREGIKWSDGEPLNADDFIFWWEAEANNEELNPLSPEKWKPVGWVDVEKLNDYAVKIYFDKPNPLFMKNKWNKLGRDGWNLGTPAHFLKQYHPQYTDDKEELQELVEEEGFDEWYQLYEYIKQDGRNQTQYSVPTLGAYIVKESSPTSLLLERNPYYSFVDREGNQLPYIDRMRIASVEDWEMYNAKASTGQVTTGVSRVNFTKIPLYKNQEEKENFHINLGQRTNVSDVQFMPNMNHKDPKIAEIIQKDEFRQALSLALDREEMNEAFFFGMGVPYPVTAHSTSPYYKKEFQKYIEHDPEKAKNLLDKINVVDKNDDGFRELPDGSSLQLNVDFFAYRERVPKIVEMAISHWEKVGLNIEMKSISFNLWNTRVTANEHDITLWTTDPTCPLTFPASYTGITNWVPLQPFPYYGAQWMKWSSWVETDGEEGQEPPKDVKKLVDWYEEAYHTIDETHRKELIQKILEVNAEKVWSIGTIGLWKSPRIVNDNLKNVPENFLMSHSTNSGYAYYPNTWYFEGGEVAD